VALAPAKPVSSYKLIGSSPPRIDIPAKANGSMTYVHNLEGPRDVARAPRPPRRSGCGRLEEQPPGEDRREVDQAHRRRQVVRLNDFVAVVAPTE
jgi:nicotinate dehydrogenase subunit B